MRKILMLLLLLAPAMAQAQTEVLITKSGSVYILQGNTATLATKVIREGGKPPVVVGDPPVVNDTTKLVRDLTDKVTSGNINKLIVAALYTNAGEQVLAGKWQLDQALQAVLGPTRKIVQSNADWKPWVDGLGNHFDALARRSNLNGQTFLDVAAGIKQSMTSSAVADPAFFSKFTLIKILPVLVELFQDGNFKFDLPTIIRIVVTLFEEQMAQAKG